MKPGFYWVRIGEDWTVGKLYGDGGWGILGYHDDTPPDEIGEEIRLGGGPKIIEAPPVKQTTEMVRMGETWYTRDDNGKLKPVTPEIEKDPSA